MLTFSTFNRDFYLKYKTAKLKRLLSISAKGAEMIGDNDLLKIIQTTFSVSSENVIPSSVR